METMEEAIIKHEDRSRNAKTSGCITSSNYVNDERAADDQDDDLQKTIRGTSIEDQSKPVSFTKLIGLAYPERHMLLLALLLMIASEGLGLVIPLLIAGAYDALVNVSLTPSQRMSEINEIMIFALVLHVVSIVTAYLRAAIMGATGVRIVARTRNRLYQCILKQEIAFFDVTKTGELTSRLGSDTGLLEEGISTAVPEVTIGLIVVTASIAIMLWISWKLALLMVGFLVLTLSLSAPFGISLGKLSKSYQDFLGLAQTHSTEALGAIRTVHSFAAEDKELHRYTSIIGKAEQYKYWWPTDYKKNPTTYSYAFFKSHATVLMFVTIFGLGFGALYIVLWYGLKLVNDGELTLGELTAFQSYIFQIGASLGQTSQFISKLIETQGAASRLFYLMERTPAIQTPPNSQTDDSDKYRDKDVENPGAGKALTLSSVQGAIGFNNISFAYPTRPNLNVLRNFSLSVAPNQTAAIVGASGAGKSTIIGLLQRFYDVCDGSVTLDGYDIRTLDVKWLRSQMAYVQQEPQLFGLTIRENIAYGCYRENVTQEEIETASKDANAHEFISTFPDGYETLVGERGIQLSGGQKQRIAIARALLPQPRILLLDEATSALDAESEHLVQEAIDKAMIGRTVMIVAHRLSTVQRANQIVVVDDHQIVDAGTHSELLRRCSKYQELIKRQALIGSNSCSE